MVDVSPLLLRQALARHFGNDHRTIAAFEQLSETVQSSAAAVAETQALKDATVIVLSANGDFTNERILEVGEGIDLQVTDTKIILTVKGVALTQDARAVFVPPADVVLLLPAEGTLVSDVSPAILENKNLQAPLLSSIPNFANDTAAAAGGVAVAQMYRNGSQLMVRVT